MADLLASGVGLICGLLIGLTGAGGTLFAVPLLLLLVGLSVQQAVPLALMAVMLAGALGSVIGLRAGYVRYRAAGLMAAFGLCMAPLGFGAAAHLPDSLLSVLLAAVMLVAALRMWLSADRGLAAAEAAGLWQLARRHPQTGRFIWRPAMAVGLAGIGAVAGLLAGLLGVGGGFIVVPALRAFTDLDIRSAIGTSLLCLTLISAGTLILLTLRGDVSEMPHAAPFIAGTVLGVGSGRLLSNRLSPFLQQRGFALLLVPIALVLVLQGLSATFD